MTDATKKPMEPASVPRRVSDDDKPWDRKHHEIVRLEIEAINTRREESRQIPDPEFDKTIDVAGLALSGGGIRSSAVCLGVLQALNHHDLLKRVDYLSTVSGGGYIGGSLTATMTRAQEFVFGKEVAGAAKSGAAEISDTPAVGHIRNYSNYLIPAGARDALTGMAIVVRGLVANFSLTLPVVLLLAVVTVLSNQARSCLYAGNFFGFRVGSDRLFEALGDSWIADFGFILSGLFAALVILVIGFIHRLVSKVDRRYLFRYLAGTAAVLGVICNLARYLHVEHFSLTLATALLGLVLFFAWAVGRSMLPPNRLQEFRGHLSTMGATYLVLLVLTVFFEFQPFMLAEMFDVAEGGSDGTAGLVGGVAIGWIKSLAAITAPIAAAVALFRQQFADLLKGAAASDLTSRLLAYAATAAVWIAGLALPLLIWIGFLYLSYWGIANDKVLDAPDRQCQMLVWGDKGVQPVAAKPGASLAGKIQFNSEARTLSAEIGSKDSANPQEARSILVTSHIPGWLLPSSSPSADPKSPQWSKNDYGNNVNQPMALRYFLTAALLGLISLLLTPNANSLHRLYRDRLSKAFLFNPDYYADGGPARNQPSLDQGRDFLPLDDEKLSTLLYPGYPPAQKVKLAAPYHLINTALNIQGSDFANRRGRNADFFMFSPLHVGSEATGYAGTAVFEKAEPSLDLATAVAVSGAAASSNMGASSIRSLTPTLALLNVRLGYWLKNPRYVSAGQKPLHHSTPLYLWSEITGRLYENAEAVYLTDGGHIENLGVYELLRRRCKVIIAVDAEADEPMNFSGLVTLQRYARIDLGILIDLPWTPIRTRTLELMNCNSRKAPSPAASPAPSSAKPPALTGPHVAIGSIDYGGGQKGYLVYIKSSLTGDENDYIRDYARRNDSFPHETTSDQFFSEEQFEVYRALGFHMTHGFLCGNDEVIVNEGKERCVKTTFTDATKSSIREVREALGLLSPGSSPSGEGLSSSAERPIRGLLP
jgi:Patatin-like phospholipase